MVIQWLGMLLCAALSPFAALHTCQKEQCLIRTAKCPEAFETACSKEVKFKKVSCCADESVAV